MMTDKDTIINTISEYFAKYNKVVAVYLFGSLATGKTRAFSDIDISVLVDECQLENFKKEYQAHYNNLSRLTRKDIDLVIMNTLSEGLLKQIYSKGKCIFVKDRYKLSLFNMIAHAKIADFAYAQQIMQEGVINSIFTETSGGQ